VSLHDGIDAALRDAMKARDREATSALRMVVAALKNRATADGLSPQGRLDDEVVEQVLATEVKRRNEAAAAFRAAGREQSAAKEEAEAALYARFLPEPLGDEALRAVLDEVAAELGATGPKDLGRVMQATMARVRGRADGSRVAELARQRLADG
jgi:uncharacterized protein